MHQSTRESQLCVSPPSLSSTAPVSRPWHDSTSMTLQPEWTLAIVKIWANVSTRMYLDTTLKTQHNKRKRQTITNRDFAGFLVQHISHTRRVEGRRTVTHGRCLINFLLMYLACEYSVFSLNVELFSTNCSMISAAVAPSSFKASISSRFSLCALPSSWMSLLSMPPSKKTEPYFYRLCVVKGPVKWHTQTPRALYHQTDKQTDMVTPNSTLDSLTLPTWKGRWCFLSL